MHDAPARNRLVWLDDDAWHAIEAHAPPWDGEARRILAHWRARRLPLAVGRQRAGVPPHTLCLGLPAPNRWRRRRLALDAPLAAVAACGDFPRLGDVAAAQRWGRDAGTLADALHRLGATPRVYGSCGWQHLTGEESVHDASDIDLRVDVDSLDAACAATRVLAAAHLPRRLDGELAFPAGDAVAWREFAQALAGDVRQVLVKRREGVRLVRLMEWEAVAAALPVGRTAPTAGRVR